MFNKNDTLSINGCDIVDGIIAVKPLVDFVLASRRAVDGRACVERERGSGSVIKED